jgi:hypothetical protein
MALSRLEVNLMFVRAEPDAIAQDWHRDQHPFLRLQGHAGSQSADVHAGVSIYGEYGNGDPPAGIEYQTGVFSPPTGPTSQTYIPDASGDGSAVMHTGDVVHSGTASREARVAMYVGFTPIGVYFSHTA